MKYSFYKRLSDYSAIAGITMLSSNVFSQVIYKNIEPDFLGIEDSIFHLDLNNDGIVDLKLNQNFSSSASSSETSWENYIHEFSSFELNGYGVNATKLFGNDSIAVLEIGDTIGISSPWLGGGLMRFRSHEWTFHSTYWGGEWNNLDNNSFGNWLNETDKYIGVKLIYGGEPYFGWVRLSVNLEQFIVKDYALSEIPNVPVLAGQIDCENLDIYVTTVSGGTVSCYGNLLKLIAIAPQTQEHTYQWLKNNEKIPGAVDSVYNTSSGGDFSFSFTINSGCTDTSVALNIIFPPTPDPVISFSSDTLFSNYLYGNQWYFNQSVIPGATNHYYIVNQGGTYKVRVDTFNCYGFSSEINFFPTGNQPLPAQDFYCYVEKRTLFLHTLKKSW